MGLYVAYVFSVFQYFPHWASVQAATVIKLTEIVDNAADLTLTRTLSVWDVSNFEPDSLLEMQKKLEKTVWEVVPSAGWLFLRSLPMVEWEEYETCMLYTMNKMSSPIRVNRPNFEEIIRKSLCWSLASTRCREVCRHLFLPDCTTRNSFLVNCVAKLS